MISYYDTYMIQLLMVIVYKVRWWLMETGGILGPYVLSAQRQEHVNKIIKRIAKFCNNNNPEYLKYILQYLDIYTIGALEQNFVDDKTITQQSKKRRKSILVDGETPETPVNHFVSDCMPAELAKYFKLIEKVKKSTEWPSDLRAEYIKLFGLDDCDVAHLNMGNMDIDECSDYTVDKEYIIDSELANNVCSDDIKESTEYFKTMNDEIEAKDNSFQSDTTINMDINMNENNTNQKNQNKRDLSDVYIADTIEPPVKKKRLTIITETKESLGQLSVNQLKEQYLRPNKLKISGKKQDVIRRILDHLKTQKHTQMKLSDKEEMDCGDEVSTLCICGATLISMKIRNIYTNRNYIQCAKCQQKYTNGRKIVFHCNSCQAYDVCDDCMSKI
eukprot:282511_1